MCRHTKSRVLEAVRKRGNLVENLPYAVHNPQQQQVIMGDMLHDTNVQHVASDIQVASEILRWAIISYISCLFPKLLVRYSYRDFVHDAGVAEVLTQRTRKVTE